MEKSFVDLFEEQVLKTPGNMALVFEKEQVSYQELNERANMLANYLRSKGVQEETLIPLFIERGINMMVGMLGIMKAGGAYVPVDTDFPSERISYMLADTGATIVVSSKESASKLPFSKGIDIIEIEQVPDLSKENLPTKVRPGHLAYIIYTSGSTGMPKGVMVEHGNLVDYITGLINKTQINECKSFALVSTIATDLGNTVIYGALATGGALHLFTKESVSNIELLHRYFASHTIDCLKIVPSHWKVLNLDDKLLLPAKLLVFGGEALPEKIVEDIRLTGTQCRIVNHYGPTETTIGKLLHIVEPGSTYEYTVPIGKPFSNTKVLVLTKNLKLCPIGVPGQLYIAGDGVARGYLNNPELTREKFISNPFSKEGAYPVMYSTGDMVKYLPDGNISFIGRVDNQVKIRGYRIELGEIENILQKCELVSQAVVLAREDKQGNKRLVGYIVPEESFDREGILNYLKEKLPDYMIPAVLMEMESFPLTANGKIDRNALPDPDASELLSKQYVAPRNDVEATLAALWKDVLEVDQVGMNDDFFELGGHSLLAVRLVSAIRKAFEVEMPIGDIFDYPTVALLAAQLSNNTDNSVLTAIETVSPRPQLVPLSFSQERLWFIDRLEGSKQYQVPTVIRLKGKLNKDGLAFALKNIIERHEVLRTVIRDIDGQGYQFIKGIDNWQLQLIDGSQHNDDPGQLKKQIQELIKPPFNLAEDFMLRAALITINEEEHVLVVTMHHIASDGWSNSILVKELVELYSSYCEGRTANLMPLSIQYADFAMWQRNYLKGEILENKLAYWKNKLDGVLALQMPTDFPRPVVQSNRGAIHNFRLDKELFRKLQELCKQQETTMFMTLLTAYKVLLYRYSGQVDICVGSAIAGRQQQETEGLIGFFINTLALRSNLGADPSFTELLQQVKVTTMEAYAHQEMPFEKIVDAVNRERDMGRSPLFQVAFVLQNTPEVPQLRLGDVQLSRESFEHVTAQFDLVLRMMELPESIMGSLEYCVDLYKAETVGRMMDNFQELLRSVVDQPNQKISRLSVLTAAEQNKLLVDFNNTTVNYPLDKTLITLFEEQVAKTPGSPAVEFGDVSLTYQELNEKANRLGHFLVHKGVRAETLVPICINRTIDMVVAILGVLKAGGAYVPIDPEYPSERIGYMLEDTGAKLVICSEDTEDKLDSSTSYFEIINLEKAQSCIVKHPGENLPIVALPGHLAYIIYTSGSTGTPKGVMVEHKGVVNLCFSQSESFGLKPGMRTLQFASFGFDASCSEIFNTLLSGGSLVLCSKEDLLSAEGFEELINRHHVEIVTLPCSYQHIVKDSLGSLKTIVSAGEALKEEIGTYIQSRGIRLINAYGPTENTVCVSLTDDPIKENKVVVIGKPISNVQVHIVDSAGNLAPIGSIGEICAGGVQVARGYLNRAELSAEKFIHNPFTAGSGSVMYKTGDLGKWLSDGNIEFYGRRDEQVKVRGYRIELGEIESVLQNCEFVKQAVVLAKEDKEGGKRLVGYIVPQDEFDRDAIVSYLSGKLPEYMVPESWIEMDEFPLTANGKIDRKALPDADASGLSANQYEAPRDETEQILVTIWEELLELDRVGINDDFFVLGGHSLLAIRLISSIRKELSVELPISDVFDNATIASQALLIKGKAGNSLVPSIGKQVKPDHIPLSFSQERLWFIDQLEGTVQYHIPTVLKLNGNLDKEALENALRQIINRHEILRTVYLQENGVAWQDIREEDEWRLLLIDNPAFKEDQKGLQQNIQLLIRKPFDLAKDYMLRAALITIGPNEHILVTTLHHIASDGWSTSIIVKELVELYNAKVENRQPFLPLPGLQFSDFAIWQRNYLQGEVLEKKVAYWKDKLNGVAPLELPTDFARPAVSGTRGSSMTFTVEQDVTEKLQELSQQNGVTLFMTLLGAFKVLLYRYSGQHDICVGTPVAGRQQQEVESIVGFFINTLALRTEVDGNNSFEEVLQKVRTTTMEAYDHQEVPFEKVVEVVAKERNMSRSPVFQVMFVLQNTPEVPAIKLGDVQLSTGSYTNNTARYELTLNISETSNGLQASVQYSSALFNEQSIGRLMAHFKELLQSIIIAPKQKIGALPMMSREEEMQLLSMFNDKKSAYPKDKSIIDLFEQQVAATPNATALVFGESSLSYHELNSKANQLAHFLISKGVKAETMVPVCIERSVEMMVSFLGILKAGAAYVPLDAGYPSARIGYMINDAGAKIIVTNKRSRAKLQLTQEVEILEIDDEHLDVINVQPVENVGIPVAPHHLANIIYTSGSTGRPKGVLVEHGNVVSLVCGVDYVTISKDDVLLSTGSPSFDATTFEYWAMLLNGGQLVLCAEDRLLDAALLKNEITQRKVSRMWFTSSWFNQLVENDITVFKTLKTILVGGEKLSEHHIRKIRETYPQIEIINGYGPTENTTFSLTYRVKRLEEGKSIPIGSPLNNRVGLILSKEQQLVPVGVAGEIYLGGAGLSRGYLNRPELSKEKFINNPFNNNGIFRLYKTGDLGRWLPDGNIEYLGRLDDQVKIRGFRIELGEIQTVVQQSGLVSQSAIVVKENKEGHKRLIGYVVPNKEFTKDALTVYLKNRLPEYMVPGVWVSLVSLPLTINGKIDTKALPDPDVTESLSNEYVGPRNELEANMVEIWQQILNVKKVGINDNFFELGGHSLLVIKLVSLIRQKLELELIVNDIFIYPTIREFTRNLVEKFKNPSKAVVNIKYLVPLKTTGTKPPLYIVAGGGGTARKFMKFAEMMDPEQPVYSLQPPVEKEDLVGFPETIEEIAATFIEEIVAKNPDGPYGLSGHCLGGIIAFEMARQLVASGKKVQILALFDTIIRERSQRAPATLSNLFNIPQKIAGTLSKLLSKIDFETYLLRNSTKQAIKYKIRSLRKLIKKMKKKSISPKKLEIIGLEIFKESSQVYVEAGKKYRIIPYEGEIVLFYAKERYYFTDTINDIRYKKVYLADNTKNMWRKYASDVTIHDVEGDHSDMFESKNGDGFPKLLQKHLDMGPYK